MQFPRRPAPGTSYESQAARWKQGFKPAAAGGSGRQTDLEGALVAELCSSIGSSSFPPREVLNKLLRYLHTLDHEYVCELLGDKLQSPLWQVQAKAVSVLDAILKSSEAELYKRHYFDRLDVIEALCQARKDVLRSRADKVYNMLKDYAPPPVKTAAERGFMHTSPVIGSTHPPTAELMPGFDSPRSNSEPLPGPAPVPVSAFSFIAAGSQEPDEAPEPSPLPSPSASPTDGSAFSFLNGGAAPAVAPVTITAVKSSAVSPPPPQVISASPPAATSAFAFIAASSSPAASPPSRPMAIPSAPSMSAVGVSGFSFLNQPGSPAPVASPPPPAPLPAPAPPAVAVENKSAFAFLAATPATASPPQVQPQQPRHSIFDSLPPPKPFVPGALFQEQTPPADEKPVEEEEVDPIHDAFEGLSTDPDAEHPMDGGSALRHVSLDSTIYMETETSVAREDIREVILEVEMPPGPMGIMLDRTITDMIVIDRFIPLPSGDKGYLEMHPAIVPGCALVSINSIHVEDRGIDEVGPILASLGASPKLLRFKKLMCQGRTVNPSTLTMPYVPPPLQREATEYADDEEAEEFKSDDELPDGGEVFISELNGYNDGLSDIEKQLDALILKERNAIPVSDRRNALAQMHGHVERIQTQGIDSVIFGPNPPPNYEQVKQYRSSLVRKVEALGQRIHLTVTSAPGAVPITKELASSVSDPPLGISQLQAASGFQFIDDDAQANVETDRHSGSSYGFSFLRDPPAATQSSISQAPTSPSSSFGFMQNSAASVGAAGLETSAVDGSASVFSGLSMHDDAPSSFRSDPLSESSHGRPMGIQDLSLSVSSMTGASTTGAFPGGVSMATSSTMASAGASVPSVDTTYSAFGFLSTNGPSETLTSSSSSVEQSTSPTAFGFLQGNTSASTAQSAMLSSVEPSESGSVFSFISN